MAESIKFTKGMVKDTGKMDQIDGTFRDALNLIVDDQKFNVGNEYGTTKIGDLTVSLPCSAGTCRILFNPIGQIALLDDNFLVMGAYALDDGPIGIVNLSAIFKVNIASHTTKLLYLTWDVHPQTGELNPKGHLNFDVNHPITGEFRMSPLGEVMTYFTDNKYTVTKDATTRIEYVKDFNPPRVFNVTKQEASLASGNTYLNLYGNFSRPAFLNLFMDAGRIPEFDSIKILKGGGVETGAYYLGVAYADSDNTETNVLGVSNPVYVVPLNDDTIPREMISGAPKETQTSKSILWKLKNINTEYKSIVPYIIQYVGTARFVYKLENVEITSSNVDVVYSGLEQVASSSIQEAVIDKVRYLTAKTITQLDNKMYVGNLTARRDLGYQRFANRISLYAQTEDITPFDPRHYDIYNLNEGYAQLLYPDMQPYNHPGSDGSSGYSAGTFGSVPYIHLAGVDGLVDSYVANVIVPIQQGTSSGYRDPDLLFKKKNYRRGEVYAFYISFILKDGSESFAYHIPGRDLKENFEKDWSLLPNNIGPNSGPFKANEITAYDPSAKPYQYLDTGNMYPINLYWNTGYWENQNELYPSTEDFDAWKVDNNGLGQSAGYSYRGTNVRHHKMPSNHNFQYSYVKRDEYFGFPDIASSEYLTSSGSRTFNDKVRLLGFKLSNIKIPKFILEQVQGYKVYYAKRTQGNKTIIGQSGVHPGTSYLAANLANKSENALGGPYFNIWALDGHQKYGGLIVSNALWAPSASTTPGKPNAGTYIGNPVIKFHDFNLLRKKHTLATATHIDIQYIVMMENWRGGYKGALARAATGTTGIENKLRFYTSFRQGIGDDAYSWIHPDLGNMINFNVEDQNNPLWDNPGPSILWGNIFIAARYSTPGQYSDSTGNQIDIGANVDTSYTGQDYLSRLNGLANQIEPLQSNLLSETQTIFMLEPEGATYINGLSILKSITANGFKNAAYLHNASGESAIVLGMSSGLPMLGGYRTNEWSFHGLSALLWSLPIYGTNNNQPHEGGNDLDFGPGYGLGGSNVWINDSLRWQSLMTQKHSVLSQPDQIDLPSGTSLSSSGFITINGDIDGSTTIWNVSTTTGIVIGMFVSGTGIPAGTTVISVVPSTYETSGTLVLSANPTVYPLTQETLTVGYSVSSSSAANKVGDPKARPNIYLVNLCSNKTDVFEPFDQQELVWTGYYKSLLSVDIENGVEATDTIDNNYYGDGPSASETIFGGDTYLCKYSYRTTSTLYGIGRLGRQVNRHISTTGSHLSGYIDDYIFGDTPVNFNEGTSPSFGSNIMAASGDYKILWFGGSGDAPLGGGTDLIGERRDSIGNNANWSVYGNTAYSTIYQFIVESDDNINYRHSGDIEKGVSEQNSLFFDKYTGADVVWRSPLADFTKMDNLLYEDHYSALQDLRVTVPYPKKARSTAAYPNRVIKSATQDGNFSDAYRYFLPLEYKDFGVNKGPITNIFNLKALLYVHTEKSLFRTKGKQTMELSDATQAYIGSGDLFAQEPDEFVQSTEGFVGLQNKLGALVTKDGYIFVARKSKRIFLIDDKVTDLTELGITAWARENIPFALEGYGWDPDIAGVYTDAPTSDFGFLVSYDPLFKRTIITKREYVPTETFIAAFRTGTVYYSIAKGVFMDKKGETALALTNTRYFKKGGWTLSFSHGLSVWASRHSYIPALYAYNSKFLYSFSNETVNNTTYSNMYEHSDLANPCNFYGKIYNFEIDCIMTGEVVRSATAVSTTKDYNRVYGSFNFTTDVFSKLNPSVPVLQQFDPGFTSFYVYNTNQISMETALIHLTSTRKVDNGWSVNAFRDMSKIAFNTNLADSQVTVQNTLYEGTYTPSSVAPMFLSEGVINSSYIDSTKPWYEQRKFVDKFLGIRLIANNFSKNLINLYTVTASSRISPR